jgi:allophanate hydrolase
MEEWDRPEVWITLRAEADVAREVAAVEKTLPLAGKLLAVKDNIDVAGLPTTAGCPAYAYTPDVSAPAVARLVAAGAVVLGKTNLDQFATGLVGTRSPYGAVRDARRAEYVSGGSSSGSAVAVALGFADLALGTDTAGSGRVPAAFGGIVGVKPTRGLIPMEGVVPACRSFDVVTTMAADLALAEQAMWLAAGAGPRGGTAWPCDAPLAAPPSPRVGVLRGEGTAAYAAAAARLADAGAELVEVDPAPFLEAGALLYDGAFVAERYAAVGAFVCANRPAIDPTVAAIIGAARGVLAHQLVADWERLEQLRAVAAGVFADVDALLVPTTTRQPTIEEVAADPIGANSALGRYTNCANLLDLCAVAVPAGTEDGGQYGVSVYAPAFGDHVAADIARLLLEESAPTVDTPGIDLLVVGAHLAGQPLNHQLTGRGARFVTAARTAPGYRLYALETDPPKPGLVRAEHGAPIAGEVWRLPPAALGDFLAALPQPMALGRVTLEDGRDVVGFLCEPIAINGAQDITQAGGWLAHILSRAGR